MDFSFFSPWHEVLPREAGHVVAWAGGAACAPLLDATLALYAAEGVPVRRCGPRDGDPGDASLVLAEADLPGAAPLAAAAPRWPARTSLAVVAVPAAVVGASAEAAFGPQALPSGLPGWEVVTWDHLAAAVAEDLQDLPAGVPAVLAVTGLEEQPDSIGLFAFTGRMMARPELAVVLFCTGGPEAEAAVGPGGLSVRACCRADAG